MQLGSDEVNKLQKMPSRHSVGDHEPRLGSKRAPTEADALMASAPPWSMKLILLYGICFWHEADLAIEHRDVSYWHKADIAQ